MSMEKTLSILGTGIYLPPAHPVREVAAAAGADVSNYQGWPKVCHAREDDQPSTMGATALRAALTEAGVAPEELRLVLFAGISRDYLPSFSVATEIMQACGAQGHCLGLDMTIGCLGPGRPLDMAQGRAEPPRRRCGGHCHGRALVRIPRIMARWRAWGSGPTATAPAPPWFPWA